MGEGFVVMQSNDVDIYYYQDEPGMHMSAHLHWEKTKKSTADLIFFKVTLII